MEQQIIQDLKSRMEGAVNSLKKEFSGLRTGRASADMLAPVMVDAYGALTPISQVGNITAPEPRCLNVQVWDSGLISSVEKAIRESGLGLNPMADGNLIRVPIPELNAERRMEIGKVAKKYAENARVSIRNVRRDGNDMVKKAEKDGISEDEGRQIMDKIQKLTDEMIAKIDKILKEKEADIMKV